MPHRPPGTPHDNGRNLRSNQVSVFEYVTVLISIVLGLSLTHLVTGLGELLHPRRRVTVYWVHLVWTAVLLLLHIRFWWFFWSLREVTVWTLPAFVLALLVPVLLYLLSVLALPDSEIDGSSDLRTYYYENRRAFFGTFTILMALAPVAALVFWDRSLDSFVNVRAYGGVAIVVAAALTKDSRLHAVLAVAMLAGTLAVYGASAGVIRQ